MSTDTHTRRVPVIAAAGSRRASAFLARRSLTAHRRAWAAVFAATAAASALLGAFALVLGSLLLAQPPVERYAGADAVVTAGQKVSYTAKPWGGEPRTATAYLPERVRLDRALLAKVSAVSGSRRPSPTIRCRWPWAGNPAAGRSWPAAALTPYRLTDGRAPRTPDEVVLDTALAAAGTAPGDRVMLQADGPARPYVVSGIAGTTHRAGTPAVFFGAEQLTALAGHPVRSTRSGSSPSGSERRRSSEVAAHRPARSHRYGPRGTGPHRRGAR
ncbi:hypothetical protein NKH18_41115 [Streptomyces sp. M10(2022)]